MITDEGASFLGDLKRYEIKHESYISLLNQLFDGKGDKMTLVKNVEYPVPWNSTSISIGVQQKSYCSQTIQVNILFQLFFNHTFKYFLHINRYQ